MKSLIYLMLSKSRSNLFIRLLVFVLIAYTVFTLNFTVARWYYDTTLTRALARLGIEDTLLYVEPREETAATFEYCKEKAQDVDGVRGLVRNGLFGGESNMGNDFSADNYLIASPLYTEGLVMPMAQGEWFSDTSKDVLECIVSYDFLDRYTIGEVYEFAGKPVRIVGITAKDVPLPTNQSGGTELNLNGMLRLGESFVIVQDMDGLQTDVCFSIVLDQDANPDEVAERCRIALRNVANVFTYGDLLERSANSNGEVIRLQGLIFIVMAILSLIGAGTCNLLLTLSDRRIFAIYYANGFSWESGLLLTAFQNVFSLLLPVMLGMVVFYIAMIFMHAENITISMWNWSVSGAFLLILFVLTSILPILTLRKSSPLNTIRKL